MFTNKEKIEFFNAVEDGNIKHIKYLLNKNDYININIFSVAKILIENKNNKNVASEIDIEIDFKNKDGYTPLMIASYKGNADIVKLLLEYNASVNITNNYNYTALIYACIYGNADVVKILLEHKADMYIETTLENNYLTALMIACSGNHAEIVRILLENGYDPNYKNQKGETALIYYALMKNNKPSREIIKILLEYGADINAKDNRGFTALIGASYAGKTDFVRALLENNADTEIKNNDEENTALIYACESINIDMVKALLEYNANPNVQDKWGRTPLIIACDYRSYDIAKILLDNNADINLSDNRKETPLMYSVNGHNIEIAELLLKYNPDLTLKNNYEETALDIAHNKNIYQDKMVKLILDASSKEIKFLYAVIENKIDDVLKYISEGVDINNAVYGKYGFNALLLASRSHYKEIIKILLEHNADVNFRSYLNNTALEYISNNDNNFDIAEEFIKRGADVNAMDNDGITPLMCAASYNAEKILNLLIENNAGINIQNKLGYSALILAAMHNHIDIVKILIENKADVFARDAYGRRALYYASRNENYDMFNIFKSYHDKEYKRNSKFLNSVSYGEIEKVSKYISKGIDVNFQDDFGDTPLTLAEKRKIAKMLLDNNADINKRGKNGYTPLMAAIKKEHLKLAEFFIKNNADINITDPEGNTALVIAAQKKNAYIFELLLKNGADLSINNEYIKWSIIFDDEIKSIFEKYSK